MLQVQSGGVALGATALSGGSIQINNGGSGFALVANGTINTVDGSIISGVTVVSGGDLDDDGSTVSALAVSSGGTLTLQGSATISAGIEGTVSSAASCSISGPSYRAAPCSATA